jgi:hypothetical protein
MSDVTQVLEQTDLPAAEVSSRNFQRKLMEKRTLV